MSKSGCVFVISERSCNFCVCEIFETLGICLVFEPLLVPGVARSFTEQLSHRNESVTIFPRLLFERSERNSELMRE